MEKITRQFYEQIKQSGIPKASSKVLVCVSGGPDSTALLHLLKETSHPFSFSLGIAHVNHSLRGESSDKDADYVKSMAEDLDLPFHLLTLTQNDWKNLPGSGMEEKARNARIAYFQKIKEEFSYTIIALGHTQDDLLETILFNLIRGISPEVLSSLLPLFDPKRCFYRPLLSFPKKSLLTYLANQQLTYCNDATNLEVNFSRNKIRNQVIPLLQEINPKAGESFLRFQKLLGEEISFLKIYTTQFLKSSSVKMTPEKVTLIQKDYILLPECIQLRLIRDIRFFLVGNTTDFYFSQIKSIHMGIIDTKKFNYKDKWMCIDGLEGYIVFRKR